jgi:ubiquinone/menaquinone biosynthesis C-methylase UbiE
MQLALIRICKRNCSCAHANYDARALVICVAQDSPTPPDTIAAVFDTICISSRDRVIDLGCGDARWLIEAAVRYQCRCWGCDIDQELLQKGQQEAFSCEVSTNYY